MKSKLFTIMYFNEFQNMQNNLFVKLFLKYLNSKKKLFQEILIILFNK